MVADSLRTIDVGLRLLEFIALMFPIALFLVQTAFRLVGKERERNIDVWYKGGIVGVTMFLIFLFLFSAEVVNLLDTVLAEEQFATLLGLIRSVFFALAFGTLLLLADAYFEGVARSTNEPAQRINRAHDELSGEDGDSG